ncbi:hypothetical protein LA080_007776 [Diaporthe eres]|nr:hypothetical protein LA080_007776 [Diaporthe eres]
MDEVEHLLPDDLGSPERLHPALYPQEGVQPDPMVASTGPNIHDCDSTVLFAHAATQRYQKCLDNHPAARRSVESSFDTRNLLEHQDQDVAKETGKYQQRGWLDGPALKICIPGTVLQGQQGQQGSDYCIPGIVPPGQQGSECYITRGSIAIPGRDYRQELLLFRKAVAFIFSICQATIGHTLVPTLGADISRMGMELAGNRSLQPRSLGDRTAGPVGLLFLSKAIREAVAAQRQSFWVLVIRCYQEVADLGCDEAEMYAESTPLHPNNNPSAWGQHCGKYGWHFLGHQHQPRRKSFNKPLSSRLATPFKADAMPLDTQHYDVGLVYESSAMTAHEIINSYAADYDMAEAMRMTKLLQRRSNNEGQTMQKSVNTLSQDQAGHISAQMLASATVSMRDVVPGVVIRHAYEGHEEQRLPRYCCDCGYYWGGLDIRNCQTSEARFENAIAAKAKGSAGTGQANEVQI